MKRRRLRESLTLRPSEWREVLRVELVDLGVGQDVAELAARHVIEKVVRAYLAGRLEGYARVTRSLDEAA